MKKFLSILLLIAISACAMLSGVACGGKGGNEDDGPKETEFKLVSEGASDYAIVYPASETSAIIETAVDELQYFFEEATGVKLPTLPDTGLTHGKDKSYLSVGTTALLAGAGLSDRSMLTPNGYRIETVDRSVYLVGGGVYGALNAVYEFLRQQFGYECYAPDEIALARGVRDANLLDLSVSKNPDIEWRAAGAGEMMQDTQYTRRLMMNMQSDYIIEMGGSFYHNFFGTVNPEDQALKTAHPTWFSPNNNQVCLSRDPEGLADYVFEKMKAAILAFPDAYALGFTQQDDGGWCTCGECAKNRETYGTDSATQILFMNICGRKLKEWLAEEGIDREVYLYMFAYQATTSAPATLNPQTGKYEPNAPELVLEDNVLVQYAPIYADSYHSYDKPRNKLYDDTMQAWSCLTKNFMFWSYSYYYQERDVPYFDFYDLKETFDYYKNHNVMYLFDEDTNGIAKWCDWSRYKAFLRTKLGWDTECDVSALTDAFFTNYYKDAAETMRELFDQYSAYYSMIIEEYDLGGRGSNGEEVDRAELWPKSLMDQWLRLIEKAYDDIEYLKPIDPQLWQTLYDRICLDSINFRYLSEHFYFDSVYVGDGNTLEQDIVKFGMANGWR